MTMKTLTVSCLALILAACATHTTDPDPGDRNNQKTGEICGGIAGFTCGEPNDFCLIPASGQCGAADQSGTCTPKPEICTAILLPVCGCDGVTYGNECAANSVGVSVASEGECPS